jgi:hypothetical protein
MDLNQGTYHSYLLRLWRVQDGARTDWRASLEDVQTGEMVGFQDLSTLLQYLENQTFANRVEEVILELRAS